MANPPPPRMPAPPPKPIASWRLKVRAALPWLLATTAAALLVQVYLAASGLLGAEGYLPAHELFANAVIRLVFLLVLAGGFLAADRNVGIAGIALTVLLEVQYPLIGAGPGAVRGLHAVNGVAMLLVAFACLLARLPWTTARRATGPAA